MPSGLCIQCAPGSAVTCEILRWPAWESIMSSPSPAKTHLDGCFLSIHSPLSARAHGGQEARQGPQRARPAGPHQSPHPGPPFRYASTLLLPQSSTVPFFSAPFQGFPSCLHSPFLLCAFPGLSFLSVGFSPLLETNLFSPLLATSTALTHALVFWGNCPSLSIPHDISETLK